ncbi:NERD domain-containing protein [Salibacterium salarium]|uniref:NERD domain-containing protein n=1 Tax=Salibacterium salarium TaxID=284579 RepID=A0A3R9P460_9BACI|nr:nuclease-related domain-containing protein [Salibacterium salarium]RSL29943.1 NERD domain-containing protein [Salibacterium salarium]
MIQMQRVKPMKLCQLESLHRRLDKSHPKQLPVEKALSSHAAGYRGEQAIDYHLTFVRPSHMIFHGLRLQDSSSYFQIDTLLVTPSFILIIEVKNIAGTLDFDPERFQMVRHLNGVAEGFSDPRLQVTRHYLQLERWLRYQKLPVPPIYRVVAISFPNTIIHAPSSSFGKVIHAAQLPYDIIDLEKKHPAPLMSAADMDNIASRLNRHHRPLNPDILTFFEMEPKDIKNGVICSACGAMPMQWQAGWKCEH